MIQASSDSSLQLRASQHAQRLVYALAACIAFMLLLVSLTRFAVARQTLQPIILLVVAAAICVFASWSAVWIVLGNGRWSRRMGLVLSLYHLTLLLGMVLMLGSNALDTGQAEWKGSFAVVAGSSYAFAAQLLVSMLLVWLLKASRYRLLYFDDPKKYPHPRSTFRQVDAASLDGTIILPSPGSLIDQFVLTTLVAVYFAAWYPIHHVLLSDERMFGAPFAFVVVALAQLFAATAALVMALIPLVAGILNHRGSRFQIPLHAAIFAVVIALAIAEDQYKWITVDSRLACVTAVALLIGFDAVLFCAIGKPTRWFRFRIVRRRNTNEARFTARW